MEDNTQKYSSEDEIDLGQLLFRLTRTLKKYQILLIASIAVGLGLGFTHFRLKKPVFESSMMVRSNILTETYSNTVTENIARLIQEGSYDLLSEKLGISTDQTKSLKAIEVGSVRESEDPSESNSSIFLVSVETTDNSILADLEKGLVQYLETNEYVKKRVDLRKQRYQALMAKASEQIREIDSLKDKLNERILARGAGNDILLLNPTNIYTTALSLYKEELSYIENLELIDSIQIIEGFTAFNNPVKPKLRVSLIGGFGSGLFLAIALIVFQEIRNYLKKLEAENS